MRPISPSTNCQHQANSAYDKLAVISENMPKLLEIEQFIFELKQWLRAYIDKIKENISEENFANLANDNTFSGINTFSNVHLQDGNIYWTDALGNNLAWIAFDSTNQILTLHVQESELTLSPNIAMTVPTDADIPNSIVTYSFLHGLLQELESTLRVSTTDSITQGSTDIPTADAVYQYVHNNEFHLTLEDTVIEGSSNGVKSSGIYRYFKNVEETIDALRTQLEALSDSSSDTFDTLGVEDGIFTVYNTYNRIDGTTTFLADHYYKIESNVVPNSTSQETTYSDVPVELSSEDFECISILVLGDALNIVKVIKPTQDITVTHNTMVYTEYTIPEGNTEITDKVPYVGVEYTL